MAELHRELRSRAKNWLDSVSVRVGDTPRLTDLYNEHLYAFQDLLLKTQPWRELLSATSLLHIANRLGAFEDRIPATYQGILKDVPDQDLLRDIEVDVVAFLESLPRRYVVCIQLPRMPIYDVPGIEVVRGIGLLQTVASFDEYFLLAKGVEPLFDTLIAQPNKLLRDTTYLSFEVEGYADSSPQSHAVARALGMLKHFLFMALSERALRKKGLADVIYDARSREPKPEVDALVYCPDDSADAHRFGIPEELSELLRWIRIDESNLQVHDEKGRGMLDFRPARSGREKLNAFAAKLLVTSRLFDLPVDAPDAERLRAAMEWWVDAESVDNHTVAFLQACIGLEALLGGTDDRSRVKDRLSDRYSYLLGKTFGERGTLKKSFESMYDHRNTLVHGRRARLGTDDFNAMLASKDMLSMSIRAEVANLLQRLREIEEMATKKRPQ
jgi:hypothetical protein